MTGALQPSIDIVERSIKGRSVVGGLISTYKIDIALFFQLLKRSALTARALRLIYHTQSPTNTAPASPAPPGTSSAAMVTLR